MQRLLLIITACLALLLAGCGDDSSTTTETFSSQPREEREAREQKAKEKEEAEEAAAQEKAASEIPDVAIPKGAPPKQLVSEDLKQGSGAGAKAGDQVSVNYVGLLYANGDMFDYNWGGPAEPLSFKLGAGEVIPGWDQGIEGMKVGGERKLIIPPDLAYGEQGSYPSIPPNATLVFQVKLLGVK